MSSFRRDWITKPIFKWARRALPHLSVTEREAIEAGDVWWDGELFGGNPDWEKLIAFPRAALSAEEHAFLDGPVDELAFAAGRLAPRRGNLLIPWDPDTQRQIARRELSSIEVEAFATTTAEDAVVVWMANTSQPSTTVIWRRSAFDQPGEPVFKQEKLRDISGAATARSLRLPDVPWTREKGFATVAKFVCGMSTRRRKKGEPPGAFTTGSAVSPSATMGKFSQQAVAGDGKIVVASKANCACGTHRPAAKSANLLPDTRTSLRGHSGAGLGLA